MTTHTWGEDPRGVWTLSVGFNGDYAQYGTYSILLRSAVVTRNDIIMAQVR